MLSTFGGSTPPHHKDNASRPAEVIISMTIQLKEVSHEDHGP